MKFKSLSLLGLTMMLASPALAQNGTPLLVPEERVFSADSGQPVFDQPFSDPSHGEIIPDQFYGEVVEGPIFVDSAPVPLFTRVKYKDKREIHPCAVKKIVRVNDPCAGKAGCGSQCVYIEICVPPCDCEEDIRCRRGGDRVRYDYGKYKVDIRVRKGFIVVDYQK